MSAAVGKKPTVGRTVRYHRPHVGIEDSNDNVPAVVTAVSDGGGVVSLTAFPPGVAPEPLTDVAFDGSGDAAGSWRWPDLV